MLVRYSHIGERLRGPVGDFNRAFAVEEIGVHPTTPCLGRYALQAGWATFTSWPLYPIRKMLNPARQVHWYHCRPLFTPASSGRYESSWFQQPSQDRAFCCVITRCGSGPVGCLYGAITARRG